LAELFVRVFSPSFKITTDDSPASLKTFIKSTVFILIGVDLHPNLKKQFQKKPNYLQTIQRCYKIFEHVMTEKTISEIFNNSNIFNDSNKIIIKPKYPFVKDLFSLETANAYIVAGKKGTNEQLPKIKQILNMI